MKSKIIWGVLISTAAALLVAGAVNRTMARSETGNVSRSQSVTSTQNYTKTESLGQGQGNGQGQGAGQGQGRNQQNNSENAGDSRQSDAGQRVEPLDARQQGNGQQGSSQNKSQGSGQNEDRGPGAGANGETTPLAEVDMELSSLRTTVVEATEEALLLRQENKETLEISGRAWRFALENGFTVGPDDTIVVVGFYDDDHFEPVSLSNDKSGQHIQMREATGRPLWAGQGWRNNGT